MSGPSSAHVEQEVKLGAWPGFEMPDLANAVPGVVVEEEPALDLVATYVDTPDLQLVRNGVSLRRRTGEGATRWTLKLPTAGGGSGLSRRELDVVDDGDAVPGELADLVTGWVRRAPLVPVTVIASHRRRLRLRNAEDAELAEVDDDEVSVLDEGEVVARFREVEVELGPGGCSELLEQVAAALTAAGAGAPDPTPKVARALGPRSLVPSELEAPELDGGASMAAVVTASLRRSVGQLVAHDHVVRLDDDIEGVHRARVGTRRLRSDLRTLAPVLAEGWADRLRGELRELATDLGRVRDHDVLLARLGAAVATLPEGDRPAAAEVVARVAAPRAGEQAELLEVMRSERYLVLLDDLVAAATEPRLGEGADEPARRVLPGLVRPRWTQLRKTVADLGPDPDSAALHGVRILVKRARYASELAGPVVGEGAAALGVALADLQDVLGDLHDTEVAEARLRSLLPGLGSGERFAAGELVATERAQRAHLRAAWPEAWAACDRKSLTGWLR